MKDRIVDLFDALVAENLDDVDCPMSTLLDRSDRIFALEQQLPLRVVRFVYFAAEMYCRHIARYYSGGGRYQDGSGVDFGGES